MLSGEEVQRLLDYKDIAICYKNVGNYKIGDTVSIEEHNGYYKINHDLRLIDYETNFIINLNISNYFLTHDGNRTGIQLISTKKTYFGYRKKTFNKDIILYQNNSVIDRMFNIYIQLPLLLIKNIEPDLLFPFSYLISELLDKIYAFKKVYNNTEDKKMFLELIVECGTAIDEIKNNCLKLYLEGTTVPKIEECDEKIKLLKESKMLREITTDFFKDFNNAL